MSVPLTNRDPQESANRGILATHGHRVLLEHAWARHDPGGDAVANPRRLQGLLIELIMTSVLVKVLGGFGERRSVLVKVLRDFGERLNVVVVVDARSRGHHHLLRRIKVLSPDLVCGLRSDAGTLACRPLARELGCVNRCVNLSEVYDDGGLDSRLRNRLGVRLFH